MDYGLLYIILRFAALLHWIQVSCIETLNSCSDWTGIHKKRGTFFTSVAPGLGRRFSFHCGLAVWNGELLNAVLHVLAKWTQISFVYLASKIQSHSRAVEKNQSSFFFFFPASFFFSAFFQYFHIIAVIIMKIMKDSKDNYCVTQ